MTRLALVLTLVLLVLPTTTAAGKGMSRVELCGADGCTDVTRDASPDVVPAGAGAAPPRAPEPSFLLRVTFAHGDEMREVLDTTWLPKSGLMRGEDGVWTRASESTQRELLRLAEGLEPRPVPVRRSAEREEGRGGGGPSALAVGAPAAALLGLVALMAQRRRRRRG